MKYFELDKEEGKILKDFEEEKLISIGDIQNVRSNFRKYAQTTLAKTKNINIRLSQKDLLKLKSKAAREGLPYQTLASSIIHRSVD
ncbi:MAG: hypothetical protein WD231_00915 [Candidatus Woykebacteria bacterium]